MYTENLKRYRVRRRQGWREEIAHTIEKDRHILMSQMELVQVTHFCGQYPLYILQ